MALLSRGRSPFLLRWILALACGAGPVSSAASAQEPAGDLERQVKAAYLLNFTRYVEWPPGAFPTAEAPINLCLLGADEFAEVLQRTVEGRRSAGRPVRVLRPDTPAQADACHLAYVAGRTAERDQWMRAIGALPTLTVGEGSRFLDRGGMIGFVIVNETVRFEIDVDAARKAGLQISSRVLTLATRLRGAPEARP